MGVLDQLQPGEEVVYRAHVTRITLIPWVILLVLVMAAGVSSRILTAGDAALAIQIGAGAIALVLGIVILWKLIVLRSFEHVLTNRRMIQQIGVFNKKSMDAPLDKVNNVEHWQTL